MQQLCLKCFQLFLYLFKNLSELQESIRTQFTIHWSLLPKNNKYIYQKKTFLPSKNNLQNICIVLMYYVALFFTAYIFDTSGHIG